MYEHLNNRLYLGVDNGGTHITDAVINNESCRFVEESLTRNMTDYNGQSYFNFKPCVYSLPDAFLKIKKADLKRISDAMIGVVQAYSFLFWLVLIFVTKSTLWVLLKGKEKIAYETLLKIDSFTAATVVTEFQVNLIFTFLTIFTVDNKWGRNSLLVNCILLAVCALVVIVFLFYANITEGPWIPIFFLLFILSFAFYFGPVIFFIINEIFANVLIVQAVSLVIFSLWIANFFVSQLKIVMLNVHGWGSAAFLWLLARFCAFALCITIKLIPEIKRKSMEEIEYCRKTSLFSPVNQLNKLTSQLNT